MAGGKRLTVAVQMDPIERINIRGDSTFALLLEAQKRGHAIAYYTPDRLALLGAKVVAHAWVDPAFRARLLEKWPRGLRGTRDHLLRRHRPHRA